MLNKESLESAAAALKSIDLSSPDMRTSRSSAQPLNISEISPTRVSVPIIAISAEHPLKQSLPTIVTPPKEIDEGRENGVRLITSI